MTAPPTIATNAAPRPGRERLAGRLLCLLGLAAALLAAGSAAAQAATVTTTVCNGAPNHAFAQFNEALGNYQLTDCQQPAFPNAQDIHGVNVGGGRAAGFKVDALPGTAFVDYHIASYGPDGSHSSWVQVIDGLGVGGNYQVHYACGRPTNCAVPHDTYAFGAVARQLRVLLYCNQNPACAGSADVVVYGAVLVIEDDNPARLLAHSGAVFARGSWHHASDGLAATIGNGAEGIKNVTVTLDGSSTPTDPACDYHSIRICPDVGLNGPLGGVTDGNHHLTITATTATGVVTTLYDDPLYSVDSTPPAAALNVALDAPGERYAPAATRTLSWTNPPGQVAPITHAVIHVCRVDSGQCRDQTADGTNVSQATITPWGGGGVYRLSVVLEDAAGNINPAAQSAPVLLRYDQRPYSVLVVSTRGLIRRSCHRAPRARHATVARRRRHGRPNLVCRILTRHPRRNLSVRVGHHSTIYAALADTAGHPLANQPIEVSQQVRGPGQLFASVGQTSTDANGLLSYRAAPGPSRTLSFAFPGTDGIKAAVADVNIRVTPKLSIRAAKGRLANCQTERFAGRLVGPPYPAGGKLLLVQTYASNHHQWVPIGTVRSNGLGHWRFAYTYKVTYQTSLYRYRVVSPVDGIYPYQAGHSGEVRVIVAGGHC